MKLKIFLEIGKKILTKCRVYYMLVYMEMIEALKKIQQHYKLTDVEMAEKLNVTRAWWNFIKNGRFPLSEKSKRKAFEAFPEELRDIFLMSNSTPRIVKDAN
jgi:DNA-binding XRE family transcriptional regulator